MTVRTIITLDDDVAAKIQVELRRSGRPFEDIVNDALRMGLASAKTVQELPPFKIDPEHIMRLKPGYNYDKVEEVFDRLDEPATRD
jgi:hypothetical protein